MSVDRSLPLSFMNTKIACLGAGSSVRLMNHEELIAEYKYYQSLIKFILPFSRH